MATWVCFKCKHKWSYEGDKEPRYCPSCGSANIYVPKVKK